MKLTRPKTSRSTLLFVLIIGILIAVNVINTKVFVRVDLTQDHLYSITSASRSIASELEEPITITTYFSNQLPSHLFVFQQRVNDILAEYTAHNNGNIRLEHQNPEESAEKEQELQLMGIPKIQFNVVEKDKFQVQNGFLGLVITYQDQQEVLPVVQNVAQLEYDITSSITKLIQEKKKRIGFLQGHNEHSISPQEEETRTGYHCCVVGA